MRTATPVPETHELDGDDALKTVRRTGWGVLAKDSVQRFRTADGFSHTRAVAFQITFTYCPPPSPWSAWPRSCTPRSSATPSATPSLGWVAPRCRTSNR
jgi:hypothetical protein